MLKINIKKLSITLLVAMIVFSESNNEISYFPLELGSCWNYNEYLEGELQDGESFKDSITNIESNNSVKIVSIIRIYENSEKELFNYELKENGDVFKVSEDEKEFLCNIFPKEGMKIGEYSYNKFLDSTNTDIRLETSDYENSSYEEQMEWQCRVFRRGVGIISFGGSSLGYELERYRIGFGTVIIMKK